MIQATKRNELISQLLLELQVPMISQKIPECQQCCTLLVYFESSDCCCSFAFALLDIPRPTRFALLNLPRLSLKPKLLNFTLSVHVSCSTQWHITLQSIFGKLWLTAVRLLILDLSFCCTPESRTHYRPISLQRTNN